MQVPSHFSVPCPWWHSWSVTSLNWESRSFTRKKMLVFVGSDRGCVTPGVDLCVRPPWLVGFRVGDKAAKPAHQNLKTDSHAPIGELPLSPPNPIAPPQILLPSCTKRELILLVSKHFI